MTDDQFKHLERKISELENHFKKVTLSLTNEVIGLYKALDEHRVSQQHISFDTIAEPAEPTGANCRGQMTLESNGEDTTVSD